MAFSEEIKLKVKKMAMFQCCRCHQLGVDVHHIIPQKDKGLDDISNAAPLCQNCHDQFGDNPNKRKEITQMRDNWYEIIEKMYGSKAGSLFPLIEKINFSLEDIKTDQKRKESDINDIKSMLKEVSNKAIDGMTLGTAPLTASNLIKASGASLSNVDINNLDEFMLCMECGEPIAVGKDDYLCPYCGSPIYH